MSQRDLSGEVLLRLPGTAGRAGTRASRLTLAKATLAQLAFDLLGIATPERM